MKRDQAQRQPTRGRVSIQNRIGVTVSKQQDRAADLDDVARQEHAQRLDVGAAALHEVAGVGVVVERRAQVVQAAVQLSRKRRAIASDAIADQRPRT